MNDLKTKIEKRFTVLDSTVECIIDVSSPIKSLIVSGAAGVGKTFTIMSRLKQAKLDLLCSVNYMNGKSTALGLLTALWETRKRGDVLVLDDIDSIFSSEDALNLLKAALDSSEQRTITYASTSKVLKDAGIPQQFKYNGKVIFITNLDLRKKSQGTSALAQHCSALLSRSVYVDLCIHTNESILVWMDSVLNKSNITGLSRTQEKEILEFLVQNVKSLKEKVSLRTVIKISAYIKKFPNTWRDIVSTLFLNS